MNSLSGRLILAIGIVLVDLLVFVIPITGLFVAYILLARPPWFRYWVDNLYND
ncbi:MAG: hypothetical protein OES09_09850 [Gammaproteobacteria bacterium]|nr:hypothetical protein [Gammaproteobacteria bacterium]